MRRYRMRRKMLRQRNMKKEMQNSLPDLIVAPEVPVRNPKERGLKVLQFTPRHSQSRAYALSAAPQLPLLINRRSLRPLRARHLFVQARHLSGSGGRVNCNLKVLQPTGLPVSCNA